MPTMTLGELYKILKVLIESGEGFEQPVMGEDGGDSYTLDGFTYVEGRLTLKISPFVDDEEEE